MPSQKILKWRLPTAMQLASKQHQGRVKTLYASVSRFPRDGMPYRLTQGNRTSTSEPNKGR
eukprot:654513-Hanusia_phi.AAC.1